MLVCTRYVAKKKKAIRLVATIETFLGSKVHCRPHLEAQIVVILLCQWRHRARRRCLISGKKSVDLVSTARTCIQDPITATWMFKKIWHDAWWLAQVSPTMRDVSCRPAQLTRLADNKQRSLDIFRRPHGRNRKHVLYTWPRSGYWIHWIFFLISNQRWYIITKEH
jgi:hypothetical protein